MGVLRGVLWVRGGGPLGGAGVLGGGLAADVGVAIVNDCWRKFAMESPYLVMGAISASLRSQHTDGPKGLSKLVLS
jgi:hypothetical protein